MFGTGETLLRTAKAVKSDPISQAVKWQAAERESEGAVVPMKRGQHNLAEGRAHTFSRVSMEVRASECSEIC